jgi:hypothetical protein
MADDKPKTPNERRKRPAPTIDLSATEVSAEPPPSQTADKTQTKEEPQADQSSPSKRPIVLALLAGMAVGAAEVLGGLWLAGALGTASKPDDLTPRIAALEAQLKTPAKPADNPALTDLTVRIGKLEQAAAKPASNSTDPAIAERLTGVENAMKAIGVTLTALNRRAEESATAVSAARERADAAAKSAEALQAKLNVLEQSAKVTQEKVEQHICTDYV